MVAYSPDPDHRERAPLLAIAALVIVSIGCLGAACIVLTALGAMLSRAPG